MCQNHTLKETSKSTYPCRNSKWCGKKGKQLITQQTKNKEMLSSILSLLAVGFLWGATNPFIRLGSKGIETVDEGTKWKNFLQEIKLIGTRLKYWIPFLLNQSGSLLYVYTLQSTSMTAAVPIANSLSFAFTAITGYILGERIPGKNVIIGTVLVCLGSSMMIYDKLLQEKENPLDMQFLES